MRAYLTGTPECKFGLNDKLVIDKSSGSGGSDAVELDDCRFHQCVRLTEFDSSRTISFIPPDGEFELMKFVSPTKISSSLLNGISRYRSTSNVKLPLRIIPTVTEIGTTQVTYIITVKANFSNKLSATSVVLRIPTPLNTTSVDCKVANGKAKYVPAENVVIWKYVVPVLHSLFTQLINILRQDSENTGWSRNNLRGGGRFDKYNTSTSVGPTPYRRRLPGPHVHCVGPDRSLPQGLREGELP